jgi:hypothetical protein
MQAGYQSRIIDGTFGGRGMSVILSEFY